MDWISPQSFWRGTVIAPSPYPPLEKQITTDVLIVGAGITGLSAALHLKAAGKQVVVLEAGRIGAGTTGGTSAHLDAHPDQGARRLIRDFGLDAARQVTAARLASIDQIESWAGDECDFQRVPAYLYSESSRAAEELHKEADALRQLGLDVSPADPSFLPVKKAEGYRIENQARFHSLKYLAALIRRFCGDGCDVFEHTPARRPKEEKGESHCAIETPSGKVFAKHVLMCTHSAFFGISIMDMRIAPYQSYMIVARVAEELPDALYWDDASPYHYIRRATGDDPHLLLIGGEDHKTGQGGDESECWSRLEQYANERWTVQQVLHRWSAEFFEPADGLPYIGHVPLSPHLFVSTGYSGTGLTFGTLAGELLAGLVLGRKHPLAEVFSPSRIMAMAAGKDLLVENLNVARHFVADRFAGQKVDALEEVPIGDGRLVRYHGSQLAVYRDEHGIVHAISPVCTHMGCHVQWNEAEHTWDCPCHGGRYSPYGERIYGPPASDLEPIPLDTL